MTIQHRAVRHAGPPAPRFHSSCRSTSKECALSFWKQPRSSPAKAVPTAFAAPVEPLFYLAATISALGGMLFGYEIIVLSGAILFIKKNFSLSASMEEIVVSSVLLGSLLGAVAGDLPSAHPRPYTECGNAAN